MTLLYNFIMATADLAVLLALRKTRRFLVWCAVLVSAAVTAVVLACICSSNAFGVLRLVSYGLFVHGTIVLAVSAVLLWPVRRVAAVGSAMLAILLLVVGIDGFLIEPNWLEVSHMRIETPKLTRPVRIVVLADLQTDRFGHHERNVFRQIMRQKPDLVLLAGDYLQAERAQRQQLCRQINGLLHELGFPGRAPAYAVWGNIDSSEWPQMFDGLPVVVVSSTRSFDLGGLDLTCLTLHDSRDRALRLKAPDPERFHLVLGHRPDFALGRIEADLLVAGHTHGGQVRLPWIGPVLRMSYVPRDWTAGLTELPGGGKLVVSRGVGMVRLGAPQVRFLCRPELAVIDLAPQ